MKFISILLVSAVLVGCASTPVVLNQEALNANKIQNVQIIDDKITFSHQVSDNGSAAGAQYGFIGSLVGSALDANANSKRAGNLTDVIRPLGNYNPNDYLKSALRNEAQGISFASDLTIAVGDNEADTKSPRITPSYIFKPNFSSFTVSLSVELSQLGEQGTAEAYLATYNSIQDIGPNGKTDENQQYLIDNPEIIIEATHKGLTEVVQRLTADMNGQTYIAKPPAPGEYPVFEFASLYSPDETVDQLTQNSSLQSEKQFVDTRTSYPDLVAQLESPSVRVMRDAAKYAGENKLYNDPGLIQGCIKVLESNYQNEINKDKYLIDGLAWCSLYVGNSKSKEALPILNSFADSEWPKKVRNSSIHASKVITGEIPAK